MIHLAVIQSKGMQDGTLRIIEMVPSFGTVRTYLERFAETRAGIVTALSDSVLAGYRPCLDPDTTLIEAVPFTELVRRFLQLAGEEARRVAPQNIHEAAVAEACGQVINAMLPGLDEVGPSLRFPGTQAAIGATLRELHAWGITADDLRQMSGDVSEAFGHKLGWLAELDDRSGRLLAELGYQTHSQQIRACMSAVPDLDAFTRRVLVLGFSEQHPLRVRWLKWAVEQGMEVTVLVERHAANADIFRTAKQTVLDFGQDAEAVGDGNELLRNLFGTETLPSSPVRAVIQSAADPLHECEWALRTVAEAEDAAIYVRDLTNYAPLLLSASRRLGIPLRLTCADPLLSNASVRNTLKVLEAASQTDIRELISVIDNPDSGLSRTETETLIDKIRTWHATESRDEAWKKLAAWLGEQPEPYQWLAEVVNFRQTLPTGSRRSTEWYSLLRGLLPKLPWMDSARPAPAWIIARDSFAQNAMQRVVAGEASVRQLRSDEGESFRAFVALCRRQWENGRYRYPASDDGIQVTANVDALQNSDTIIVLGMLEGTFPRRRKEDPILTDEERGIISRLRMDWPRLKNSHREAESERDDFYKVCAAAQSTLILSYPKAGDDTDNIPAFYIESVRQAIASFDPGADLRDIPRDRWVPLPEEATAESDRVLSEILAAPVEPSPPVAYLEPEKTMAQLPVLPAKFRPDHLRDAAICAFRYQFGARLGIRPVRKRDRWRVFDGLYAATNLAKLDLEEAPTVLFNALESRLTDPANGFERDERELLRLAGQRIIQGVLDREHRARELWPRDKTNLHFEVSVLKPSGPPPGQPWIEFVAPAFSKGRDGRRIVHLYGPTTPKEVESDADWAYYGSLWSAVMNSMQEESAMPCLEIEDGRGKREMLVPSKEGTASDFAAGLIVRTIFGSEESGSATASFWHRYQTRIRPVLQRIESQDITPSPGDGCTSCGLAEFCRRHRDFSEDEGL